MDAQTIRQIFTDFFLERDHLRVASAPLTAPGDPTLLFTSAGMVPFKPYFLGEAQAPHHRLTSIQKCFRTTDIDEVGDASHLTMFEMMGNFSLGDYFKAEAQAWAWELVTQVAGVPAERLVATVFTDDDFAYDQWRKIGLPDSKIYRYGEDQGNFWAAGPTGPCGPCSELHYDMSPDTPGPVTGPAEAPERWLEIWNLVFMQYARHDDGSRTPLPAENIDTGAGLERWAMMLQDKTNLYETDLFAPLLGYIGERCGLEYGRANDAQQRAMRIVAEHGRAMTFLIADGAIPGNEGRGYVLRRLIRRALYMADTLGIDAPLLSDVAVAVRGQMGDWYPEVVDQAALVARVLDQEEERFRQTLSSGRALLEEQIMPMKRGYAAVIEHFESEYGDPQQWDMSRLRSELDRSGSAVRTRNSTLWSITHAKGWGPAGFDQSQTLKPTPSDAVSDIREASSQITGEEAFLLYDTFGLPREVIAEVARGAGFEFDSQGFDHGLAIQRERSKSEASFAYDTEAAVFAEIDAASEFAGYDSITGTGEVLAIVRDGESVGRAGVGNEVGVVLDRTPFYPEGGGQVGDAGVLRSAEAEGAQVEVDDARAFGDIIAHVGRVSAGEIAVGQRLEAEVARGRRADAARNHTATHLLHAALREVLGDHVRQAGSLVAPDHLRFDYTQPEAPSDEQLRQVQQLVQERIRENLPVATQELPYEEALKTGAMAIFGERYESDVRVVEICDPAPHVHDCFSKELCGGTHAPATGFVGAFQMVSEGSVGAGVRRIEALTGAAASDWVDARVDALQDIADSVRATPETAAERIGQLRDELREAQRRLQAAEAKTGASAAADLASAAAAVEGVAVVAGRVAVESADALRRSGDEVRRLLSADGESAAVVVLGADAGGRPLFVAMATDAAVAQGVNCGRLIGGVARIAGGGGGGKPDMAQAGGARRRQAGRCAGVGGRRGAGAVGGRLGPPPWRRRAASSGSTPANAGWASRGRRRAATWRCRWGRSTCRRAMTPACRSCGFGWAAMRRRAWWSGSPFGRTGAKTRRRSSSASSANGSPRLWARPVTRRMSGAPATSWTGMNWRGRRRAARRAAAGRGRAIGGSASGNNRTPCRRRGSCSVGWTRGGRGRREGGALCGGRRGGGVESDRRCAGDAGQPRRGL